MYEVRADIRDALVADAREQNISINEAAVKILAEHYEVAYAPSGVPFVAERQSRNLAIRGGATLHRRIHVDAAKRSGTLRGVVLERLALHYGLEPEPIGRRPRRITNPPKGKRT